MHNEAAITNDIWIEMLRWSRWMSAPDKLWLGCSMWLCTGHFGARLQAATSMRAIYSCQTERCAFSESSFLSHSRCVFHKTHFAEHYVCIIVCLWLRTINFGKDAVCVCVFVSELSERKRAQKKKMESERSRRGLFVVLRMAFLHLIVSFVPTAVAPRGSLHFISSERLG